MTHTSDDARDGEQPHPEPAPAWQVQVDLPTAAATTDLGWRLAAQVRAGDLIVLSGGLGAGKTTLTQGIGAGLNVRGQVEIGRASCRERVKTAVGGITDNRESRA